MTKPDAALPDMASVKQIADLAAHANGYSLDKIDTTNLGPGLPKTVPVLFDHRQGGAGLVSLLVEIEKHRLAPERREGLALATTLASFIDLVNRHKDANSAIFAETSWPAPKIVAVIDYHQTDGAPRWGQHRVGYAFPVTDEFRVWVTMNGKAMEQAEFAAFLEDHAAELASPADGERSEYEMLFKEKFATPSELIALSRSLEVFVGARVKRQERLSSGERTVEFVEEHTDTKGEKVQIPGIFMVSVQAFLDGEAVRIPARLRYRVVSGGISWFYQLYRWEAHLRMRVQDDLEQAAKETALPSFEGTAEA